MPLHWLLLICSTLNSDLLPAQFKNCTISVSRSKTLMQALQKTAITLQLFCFSLLLPPLSGVCESASAPRVLLLQTRRLI
ncbi:hypothetical protein NQZ68_023793 [Dissostichus eleginoides]|nr:hypothetical protein NQZ68_023793 [Dissostichus eleginoides]